MRLSYLRIFCFFLLFSIVGASPLHAQFVTDNDEPGAQRWRQIQTQHYNIIYPEGADSLARVYGGNLEKNYFKVGASAGRLPNLAFRKKVPTVLRTNMASSNGSVVWTPHRMQLWTNPDMGVSFDVWSDHLPVHESRHLAQMQFAQMRNFKGFRYIFGEIGPSIFIALYTEQAFLEGDAVVAETAILPGGRGRNASFLNYYHRSFSSGDMRSYWKWRFGSQNKYTPDHYALGYITVAGMRTLYGEPLFSKKLFDRIEAKGLPFFNFQKNIKDISGKSFKKAFSSICDSLRTEWAELDRNRGPFQKMRPLVGKDRLYSEYRDMLPTEDGGVLAIRSGKEISMELVKIDSRGKRHYVRAFSSSASDLKYGDEERPVWWSEEAGDARWGFRSYANVRYMDRNGRFHTLTRGHRYYNPVPYLEDSVICVTETDRGGKSHVVLISSSDGSVVREWPAPEGMQLLESILLDGIPYAIGITREGAGIYCIKDGSTVVGPLQSSLSELNSHDGKLCFGCDRTGVNELYLADISSGEVTQVTTTPFGGGQWSISGKDSLNFVANLKDGALPCRTAFSDLTMKKVDIREHFEPSFAATIARQEKELGAEEGEAEFSEPEKYNKFTHLFRLHSWLPFFVDYDLISAKSFETISSSVRLGATAFLQNDLGNFSSIVGLKLDPADRWIPTLHGNFIYSGLYPAIEASFDIGHVSSGTIKTYIPWSWSRGGWLSGFIPQASFNASTSRISFPDKTNCPYTRLNLSVRGYVMRPTAESGIFPRFGVGAEAGLATYPTAGGKLKTNSYQFLYLYLPGVLRSHGMKLSAMATEIAGEGKYYSTYVNILPRGISSAAALSYISGFPVQTRFTLDYTLPFAPVDWDFLCPFVFIRNFEFNAHSDLSLFRFDGQPGNLASAGAGLNIVLGNLLWLPFKTRIGITYDYNFGGAFDSVNTVLSEKKAAPMERHKVGFTFSVDL